MTRSLLMRIWIVCALGLFVDGFDLYVTSVAEPLFQKSFSLTSLWLGVAQAAAPIGAAVGAILIGYITDRVGRKTMLAFNFILFVVATLLSAASWNVYSLCIFRFFVGFGVGADYPICAAYLSEMSPNHSRGKLMASAMFINCLASPIGIAVAYFIFSQYPHLNAWRLMFAFGALPAVIALFLRSRLPESFIWKANQRIISSDKKSSQTQMGYRPLFNARYCKATIALCCSWALMDISYYSIGLFTPDILSAMHLGSTGNFITDTKTIVENTIFLNSFVALGAFISIFVIDKVPRIGLQKMGFLGAFLGLFLLSMSYYLKITPISIIFSGFLMYNLFVNMGPGATTYLLPAEIYPVRIRGTGHGLASGVAKFGAFLGTIFLPQFQQIFGIHITLFFLSFTLLLGYLLTNLLKGYPLAADIPTADLSEEVTLINEF